MSRILVLFLAALVACGNQTPRSALPPAPITEILWDTWGVPHVYAGNTRELFRAVGWAHMEAHGDLLLRMYGQARGRAAEYWGTEHLPSDRQVWTVGIPGLAYDAWRAQSVESREILEGFIAGINAWAERHRDRVPADLAAVLPVQPIDVLAHLLRTVHFTFVVDDGGATSQRWREQRGSNGWAIGRAKSASGNPLLLANPHLPWGDLFTWFEIHMIAPGVDMYGVSLVGSPTIGIGFNRDLAWTHTVNTIDAADYFELTLAPDGYQLDGKVQKFEVEHRYLKVKTPNGLLDQELLIRRSVHGPIVAATDKHALALRVAGLDRAGLVDQYWAMMRAKSFGEFEAALRRLQVPMFTVMYADREGHIMHLFNGTVPVRSGGTFADYMGVVPGDRSATLWTKIHGYDELPRVVDPPSGWLQNANDPPWTTTIPLVLDPAKFPSYMAPRGMELRPQRSARMLIEDDKITLDELVAYQSSTRLEMADRLLDDLLPLARSRGSERAKRAADVLERWDRNADAQSRGAVLFRAFAVELRRAGSFWQTPWSPDKPLATPDGFAKPDTALAALDAAAKSVEDKYKALDVPWGDVYRLRLPGRDLPANGASSSLGSFRVVQYEPGPDGKHTAVAGDSFIAAIELGARVRARVLLSYGNSSRQGSPHRGDQMELFAKKELREAWLERAEIEARLEKRDKL